MGGGADGLEYLPCPVGRMSAESTVVKHLLIDEAIRERLRGPRSATDLKTPSHQHTSPLHTGDDVNGTFPKCYGKLDTAKSSVQED